MRLMQTAVCADGRGQRKVFLPNKLLECVPRLTALPNERLRWNTNEVCAGGRGLSRAGKAGIT